MTKDLGEAPDETVTQIEDAPISRQEARDLIDQREGTVGLEWYLSLILVIAASLVGISILTSDPLVTLTDYLAVLILVVFEVLALSALFIIHMKPVSFDGQGICIGWVWATKERYDWEQVIALENLPLVPGVALLRLKDKTYWPIVMSLENARHLNDAILIWNSAR